jgi:hypothetical protein
MREDEAVRLLNETTESLLSPAAAMREFVNMATQITELQEEALQLLGGRPPTPRTRLALVREEAASA